jgi:hypothetical protein
MDQVSMALPVQSMPISLVFHVFVLPFHLLAPFHKRRDLWQSQSPRSETRPRDNQPLRLVVGATKPQSLCAGVSMGKRTPCAQLDTRVTWRPKWDQHSWAGGRGEWGRFWRSSFWAAKSTSLSLTLWVNSDIVCPTWLRMFDIWVLMHTSPSRRDILLLW